jgi:hypothetical protein
MSERRRDAPPAGEDLHLPGGTPLPIINAGGVTVILIGVTTTLVLVFIGLAIFLVTLVLWIRDAREEFDELPPEPHH